MKYFLIAAILSVSVFGSEMDRIEAIVEDIAKLRKEYSRCKDELAFKTSNEKPNKKIKNLLKTKEKEILELENKHKKENTQIIKKYEKIVKTKDLLIENLENQIIKLKSSKKLESVKCEEVNKFPKLVMKDDIKNSKKEESKSVARNVSASKNKTSDKTSKLKFFKASAFRLNKDSDIYDSIDGKKVYRWENKTSFTSNVMNDEWIKITGYFVNKQWQKSDEELWIKKINTIKR